jgi:hypothetical protein
MEQKIAVTGNGFHSILSRSVVGENVGPVGFMQHVRNVKILKIVNSFSLNYPGLSLSCESKPITVLKDHLECKVQLLFRAQ